MTDRPTHLHKASGSAVFPDGYKSNQIELLPDGYWEAQDRVSAEASLRTERDARLSATDWTQLADQPEAISSKWQGYRQALRDLPETVDPLNVEWPAKPD